MFQSVFHRVLGCAGTRAPDGHSWRRFCNVSRFFFSSCASFRYLRLGSLEAVTRTIPSHQHKKGDAIKLPENTLAFPRGRSRQSDSESWSVEGAGQVLEKTFRPPKGPRQHESQNSYTYEKLSVHRKRLRQHESQKFMPENTPARPSDGQKDFPKSASRIQSARKLWERRSVAPQRRIESFSKSAASLHLGLTRS